MFRDRGGVEGEDAAFAHSIARAIAYYHHTLRKLHDKHDHVYCFNSCFSFVGIFLLTSIPLPMHRDDNCNINHDTASIRIIQICR